MTRPRGCAKRYVAPRRPLRKADRGSHWPAAMRYGHTGRPSPATTWIWWWPRTTPPPRPPPWQRRASVSNIRRRTGCSRRATGTRWLTCCIASTAWPSTRQRWNARNNVRCWRSRCGCCRPPWCSSRSCVPCTSITAISPRCCRPCARFGRDWTGSASRLRRPTMTSRSLYWGLRTGLALPGDGRGAAYSVVAQFRDQFVLGQTRVPGHAKLFGALLQLRNRPVLVGRRLSPLAAHRRLTPSGRRVGNPRGLLLGITLFAQILVHLFVLDRRIRHDASSCGTDLSRMPRCAPVKHGLAVDFLRTAAIHHPADSATRRCSRGLGEI